MSRQKYEYCRRGAGYEVELRTRVRAPPGQLLSESSSKTAADLDIYRLLQQEYLVPKVALDCNQDILTVLTLLLVYNCNLRALSGDYGEDKAL